MKFDFAIGNPPYQGDVSAVNENEGNKTFQPPVYNIFMDEAFKVAEKVELITPARFLFNAGSTPRNWNEKMLNDPHFKVLNYEADASKIFSNVDIKGGVAITYRDENNKFGSLGVFTAFKELNNILKKVNETKYTSLSSVIYNRGLYRFSAKAYKEHSEELRVFSDSRIGSGAFEKIPSMFTESKPEDGYEYVQFFGLMKGKRVYRWLRKDYFNSVSSFEKYKVFVPAANGSGTLGEVLSTPVIGHPVIGHTETFLSVGCFDTEKEAIACYKYVCSKFARTMLGVLKVTQHNSPEKWEYVPLQDFTSNSDINWGASIKDIDRQLYKKYKLSADEIDFIETNIKEMD